MSVRHEITTSVEPQRDIASSLGDTVADVERALIATAASRVHAFRMRHPWLYGLAAFVAGGGFIAVFTMTTYKSWVYQSIDLEAAVYQVIAGGLGGGVVAVILAFAYARTIRPTLAPMRADGVTAPMRADSVTAPMRADGVTAPMRADSVTAPMRADGVTAPAGAAASSGKPQP